MIFQAHSDAELTDSQLDEPANHLVNKRRELAGHLRFILHGMICSLLGKIIIG